jgi:hypothetical protein
MKTPTRLVLRFVSLACMASLVACSSASQPVAPVPSSAPTPRVLTDLSSLSAAPSKIERTGSRAVAQAAAPAEGRSSTAAATQAPALRRLLLQGPGSGKFAGSAAAPGDEKLMNPKAEQFSQFSDGLLHQVFIAAQQLEHGEIARQSLPESLKPAIITAIMDKDGKLKELILEQHSGSGAVDKLMIDACKRGLWTSNPPPAALTPDGNYRMRVQGSLKNFNTMDGVHWNFETHLGIALL